MKTCLLTGGTGLIGSQLLGELPDKGWNIIALTRRGSHGHHPGKGRGIQHISCDFSRDENRTEWPGKVDAVIHLAQSERFRDFPEHAEEIFRVNTLSTLSLLDHARSSGAKTFIYASSGGIYGTSAQPLKEEPFSPSLQMEFYPATKICSEMLCQAYRQHLRVIILRFFFVYGPGQRPAMLIPRMVNSVRDGKPVTLQGNDGLKINPIYVFDAVHALSRALDLEKSQEINVAGPEILSIRQMADMIGQAIGKTPVFKIQPVSPQNPNLVADIQKMSKLLVHPRVKFQDGITEYLKNLSGNHA